MNIEKNNISLVEDIYAYWNRASEKDIFNMFKEKVHKYINTVNSIVNTDFEKLSDEEFYDLLCNLYSINLTEMDYLKILSQVNNKKYNRFTEIGTYMTFPGTVTEGHGHDFSWWEQLYQVKYIIAVSEDINIEYDSIFSKEDIKSMIENKNIVIVNNTSVPLDLHNNPNFKQEEVETLPSIHLNFSRTFDEFDGTISKKFNFPIVASMLRRKFTKKKVLDDMRNYIDKLQAQINEVLSYFQHNQSVYIEIFKLCSTWFENSEEKQVYNSLVKKLHDKIENDL